MANIQFVLCHNCIYVNRQSLNAWLQQQINNTDGSEEYREGMRAAFWLLRGMLADLNPNTATEKQVGQ